MQKTRLQMLDVLFMAIVKSAQSITIYERLVIEMYTDLKMTCRAGQVKINMTIERHK